MTFYTILPVEQVFPHEPTVHSNYFEMTYNGVNVVVEHDGGKTFRIHRIISTDPLDFLNEKVQPGALISIFKGIDE